jgi:hypothetical protein
MEPTQLFPLSSIMSGWRSHSYCNVMKRIYRLNLDLYYKQSYFIFLDSTKKNWTFSI